MMHPEISVNSVELIGSYTHEITLPSNAKILDLIRRNVQGFSIYTLVYQYDNSSYNLSQYEILFKTTGYIFQVDRSYNYLATVQQGYDEAEFSIVYWRKILTDSEKRELKIEHLLI